MMDDDAFPPPPGKSILFYLATALAVLTVVLFFYWIFSLRRTTAPPASRTPTVAEAAATSVIVTENEAAKPTEAPPPPDAPIAPEANPTALLEETGLAIIPKKGAELRHGAAENSADRLEFMIEGQLYRFQLPGIDALATSTGDPQVRAAQAGTFRSHPEQIAARGDNARDWAHGLLKDNAYKIMTEWKPAPGKDVYFAHIFLEYEKGKWTFLSEFLLARGDARLNELPLMPPLPMVSEKEFTDRHRQAQAFAQKQKKGIWGLADENAR